MIAVTGMTVTTDAVITGKVTATVERRHMARKRWL